MKKRVFAIVLTIILCTSVFSLSAFATDLSSPISRTQLLKIAEMQRGAVDAHEELYKTFLVDGGYAYGAVSSSNTTWYSSGNPDGIHGLVDVRLSLGRREPGDSGGPIYTADGLFCGTHTGAADEDNYGFSHIVFSPYVYVRNLGFSALTS